MTDDATAALVREVTRELVAELAPQELLLFPGISAAYFKHPDRPLPAKPGREALLGFGAEAAVMLMTPAMLAAVTTVVKYLLAEVEKSAEQEGSAVIQERVRALFARFRSPGSEPATAHGAAAAAPTPLSPAQLSHVRQLAYEEACADGIDAARAGILADSIVGKLAISPA